MPLPPKPTAVLWALASRAGQLVTKAELLDAAWPDTAVTDAVLTGSIRALREALGDVPTRPRYVETVHRRGYRFVAPVQGEADAGHPGLSTAPDPPASGEQTGTTTSAGGDQGRVRRPRRRDPVAARRRGRALLVAVAPRGARSRPRVSAAGRRSADRPGPGSRSCPSSLGYRIAGLARPELLVEVELVAVNGAQAGIEWIGPDPADPLDHAPLPS